MRAKLVHFWRGLPPGPRKIAVTFVGGLLLIAGALMIVLPGPAFLVLPAALAVLATEYRFARRALDRMRGWIRRRRRHAPERLPPRVSPDRRRTA